MKKYGHQHTNTVFIILCLAIIAACLYYLSSHKIREGILSMRLNDIAAVLSDNTISDYRKWQMLQPLAVILQDPNYNFVLNNTTYPTPESKIAALKRKTGIA
jgi:hypothetical protein